ncbi:MAG: tetratricopeptide repeat protein [Nannocystaceae bacterium]
MAAAGTAGPPEVTLDDLDGVGAPPAFAGASGTGTSSGSTLFGTIPDEALETPALDDPGASFGGDTFGELDLPMPGDDMHIDLLSGTPKPVAPAARTAAPPARPGAPMSAPPPATGAHAARPAAPPPPARPAAPPPPAAMRPTATGAPSSTRPTVDAPAPRVPAAAPPPPPRPPGPPPRGAAPTDLPTPVGPAAPQPFRPPQGGTDLPTPVGPAAPQPFRPPQGGTDLPAPTDRGSSNAFKVPSVDLPTPARPGAAPFRAPEPPPFSGAPARPSSGAPRFGTDQNMISVAELDLPSPGDFDLPAPSQGVRDLPTPVGVSDLPTPLETDLPTPADTGLLTPASLDVEPAHILPIPADQALTPAGELPQPKRAPDAAAAAAGARAAAEVAGVGIDPLGARRSPAPRAVSSGSGKRTLVLAGIGIALIGGAAGGAYALGVFDPPEDIPVAPTKRGETKSGKTPATPAATATERSADVLAQLALDTPAGYLAAIDAAEATGDRVGQAEAALMLHLRYGPDAVRAGQAGGWLEPYAKQKDPFVTRVLGLASLAAGAIDRANADCAGEGPRSQLCRAMIRLRERKLAEAITEADAVLAATPTEIAAVVVRHDAKRQLDPVAELPAIEASLVKHPKHPGLLEVGVRAALAAGMLRKAHGWIDELGPADPTSKAAAALRLRLRAELAHASGATSKAARLFEEAAGLLPDDPSLGVARVRALVAANRVLEAEAALRPLLSARPDDVEIALLAVEVKVESGKGDDALAAIQAIEAKWPGRADTALRMGQVQAMRLQSEEARTSFASALTRDPTLVRAPIESAKLLAKLDRLPEALATLDAARKAADERKAPTQAAELLRAKAALLDAAGQSTGALAAYDQALASSPNDNLAQLARGLLRLELGQSDPGKSDLLAVYERTGSFVGLTAPLGRIFVREGQYEQLDTLVGDELDDPDAPGEMLIVGARLRLWQAKPDEAKALLQRVLVNVPNDWEAHMLLAQAMLDSREFEESLAQIDRSQPTTPSAEKHLLRGKILEYLRRHAEAPAEYLKAIQIDPELDEARFLYGRHLAITGEAGGAIEELGKVVARTERFPAAFLELGRAFRESGDGKKAIANFDKAIALDPKLYEAYFLRGRAYYDLNEIGKAADSFAEAAVEAASSEPWYAEALVFLGRAHARNGKAKAAREAFEKFLSIAPANHPSRAEAERQLADLR